MVGTYPHHLLIQVANTDGSQDGDGGYNPGGDMVDIYNDRCDGQEDTDQGFQLTTSDGTLEDTSAELMIFLKDESKINDLEVDMTGTLTRGERVDQIRIINIRLIDGMIEANTI